MASYGGLRAVVGLRLGRRSFFSEVFPIFADVVLRIKNMVCDRCVMVVRTELERFGCRVVSVRLGEAEIVGELSSERKAELAARLEALGFELLEDRRERLIEAVKRAVIELVRGSEVVPDVRLSDYLQERLRVDYRQISALFSETEGRTVEKYFIAQKIERVKELLVYDELPLAEIAFRLGYSSVAHLSAQFKQVTGLTPSRYRQSGGGRRQTLDKV